MTYILFSVPGGSEIIGKVIEDNGITLTVDQPLVVRPVQRGANDFVLQLFPHSLANPEGEHKFSYSQIVSVSSKIPDRLETEYVKQTSNIILHSALNEMELGLGL